jgi:hypothetical protein
MEVFFQMEDKQFNEIEVNNIQMEVFFQMEDKQFNEIEVKLTLAVREIWQIDPESIVN